MGTHHRAQRRGNPSADETAELRLEQARQSFSAVRILLAIFVRALRIGADAFQISDVAALAPRAVVLLATDAVGIADQPDIAWIRTIRVAGIARTARRRSLCRNRTDATDGDVQRGLERTLGVTEENRHFLSGGAGHNSILSPAFVEIGSADALGAKGDRFGWQLGQGDLRTADAAWCQCRSQHQQREEPFLNVMACKDAPGYRVS